MFFCTNAVHINAIRDGHALDPGPPLAIPALRKTHTLTNDRTRSLDC